jgi:hypothetical protein
MPGERGGRREPAIERKQGYRVLLSFVDRCEIIHASDRKVPCGAGECRI